MKHTYLYLPYQIWSAELAKRIGFTQLEVEIVMNAFHDYFAEQARSSPVVFELKNNALCDSQFVLKKFSLSEKDKRVILACTTPQRGKK